MFGRRWILTTLLVLAAVGVMVRLGVWQLERLAERRVFNARVTAQIGAPMIQLTAATIELDLAAMEYREVFVTGEYIPQDEVVLRNQVRDGRPGYRLLTPLMISGTNTAVLVDRGFVPANAYIPGQWQTYQVDGAVSITGLLRRSQSEPDFGSQGDPAPAPGTKNLAWSLVNLDLIGMQVDYPLLPVYIQQKPEGGPNRLGAVLPQAYPAPASQEPELTEGPHLGYAVQWFIFAAVLALGYPFFVRRESQGE